MNVIAALLVEAAPAKINLALHVTGRRADGYHLLESLVAFAELGDRIEVRPTNEDHFFIGGRFGGELAADNHNLVLRARDALRQAVALTPLSPVSIHLEKMLPVASGIGGGSSDAAAALRLLNRLWGSPLTVEQLAALARQLGADVPMCLAARPLIARGIGEMVEPVALPALAMVLVNPGVAVSTPQVFGRLESRENPPLPPLPRHADFAGLVGWLIATRNDLEAPARQMAPVIGDALDALASSGAAFSRMSGSGATCFGLFATPSAAQAAATTIRHARPNWFVEATATN
ncbi:4-(cytidine 5'-diphospho)-2-C-methyl-D-erythritol kinase [Manganibacter manganicus]|uniref:4-diphosphocytidyl-2-C-methyl-D-erythritol kinase n=1 Tax=Manganibacter manganicus TaxID=1873176 RepID=A0A1V8RNM6_9HYPH|nr:4-(cytidine 5'-diphospho)-2-C-methyl-D-erythritol kinase [Pseudaminobacter manganicus]OQM74776.1 4-(cytidine 5'-diphospho)-2-C-methyl-D-erythritol kinase [Pseudaminobacter manganicus]